MRRLAICVAVAALCGAAGAADGPEFKFSGFGTVGAVKTDTDEAQYRANLRQNKGADKSVDFGVDSLLGLQGDVKFNDTFSAVGQLLTSRRDGSDGPVIEWLYGQAQLPAGFKLKLGRMVLPTFMISDSRSVGYAAHWLRAPADVYGLYPSSSFDGGQLQYGTTLGAVNLTAQLSANTAKSTLFVNNAYMELKAPRLLSLNLVAEAGNWSMRLGQTQAYDSEVEGLAPKTRDTFSGIGAQYDNGTLLVMSEYATRRQGNSFFESDSWYASAGWRFGAWMPYATVSRYTPKGLFFMGAPDNKLTAVGLRWDLMKNVALKFQADAVRNGTVNFLSSSPSFLASPPTVHVYSVAADFVF